MNKAELAEALALASNKPINALETLRRITSYEAVMVPDRPMDIHMVHGLHRQEVHPIMVTGSQTFSSETTDGSSPFRRDPEQRWYTIKHFNGDRIEYADDKMPSLTKEDLRDLPGKRRLLSDREKIRRKKHRKEAKASRRKNR